MLRTSLFALLMSGMCMGADPADPLPGTKPLVDDRDLSKAMLDGVHTFTERQLEASITARVKLWNRDISSRKAYETSIAPNRESFRKIIGVVDPRVPVKMERFGDDDNPALVAE